MLPVSHFSPFRTIAAAASLAVAGCAGQDAMNTERMLAAAGFQMKLAQTSEQNAQLEAFEPQRKLVPRSHDGAVRFVYADAKYCKCLYAGSEKANQRFQQMAYRQQLAETREATADAEEAAAMNWGAWGGWGPWW